MWVPTAFPAALLGRGVAIFLLAEHQGQGFGLALLGAYLFVDLRGSGHDGAMLWLMLSRNPPRFF